MSTDKDVAGATGRTQAAPIAFSHARGTFEQHVLVRVYEALTRKAPRLYFRGRDVISPMPLVSGVHEPAITAFIDHLAAAGYGDFLLDIGANIGLTSCQSGGRFQAVHMFEPNPLCCHILEVNATIALDRARYRIHPYGIGDADKTVPLTVPKDNWGGAFVRDAGNSYSEDVLARKDGFARIESGNYFDIDIELRDGVRALRPVFAELEAAGLRRGVIKIDVEGYEPVVLGAIADALPPGVQAVIVLESWDANFKVADILARFAGRAKAWKLQEKLPWRQEWPRALKWLLMGANAKVRTELIANETGDWSGNIVLVVD